MTLRTLLFATVSLSTTAFGAITITPISPTTGDTVTIRLENTFGAEAHVASADITQNGNTFTIQQNVQISCALPSNPVVATQFQVGSLPPGAYDVTANIVFTGLPPLPCSPPPITQVASFAVAPTSNIPTVSPIGLMLLGAVLAGVALASLRGL